LRTISSKLSQADGRESADELPVTDCWPALLACLRSVAVGGPQRRIQIPGVAEFLLDLLPRVDLTTNSDLTRAVDLLLRLTVQQLPDRVAFNSELLARLVEARCEPALLRTVLQLVERNLQWLDTGEELKSLSVLMRERDEHNESDAAKENFETMSRLVARVMFTAKNEDEASIAFGPFFAHLSGTQESKGKFVPTVGAPAGILVDFLERGGDMGLVLAAARSQPSWLRAKLLALGLHLLGMHEQSSCVVKPASVLASRLAVAANRSSSIGGGLRRLYRYGLPLDLNVELATGGLTAGLLLQTATKAAIEGCPLDDLLCIVSSLCHHHPHSLEPLISLILTRYS
jgi:hypothetical protein